MLGILLGCFACYVHLHGQMGKEIWVLDKAKGRCHWILPWTHHFGLRLAGKVTSYSNQQALELKVVQLCMISFPPVLINSELESFM